VWREPAREGSRARLLTGRLLSRRGRWAAESGGTVPGHRAPASADCGLADGQRTADGADRGIGGRAGHRARVRRGDGFGIAAPNAATTPTAQDRSASQTTARVCAAARCCDTAGDTRGGCVSGLRLCAAGRQSQAPPRGDRDCACTGDGDRSPADGTRLSALWQALRAAAGSGRWCGRPAPLRPTLVGADRDVCTRLAA